MTMGAHEPGAVIADDGEYFIEHGAREGGVSAPGFLRRRCYTGITSPDGFVSVRGFARKPDDRREASIDAWNDGSGAGASRSIGHFTDRINAIVALWRERHAAYFRHKED
jgi:hypothetical protein